MNLTIARSKAPLAFSKLNEAVMDKLKDKGMNNMGWELKQALTSVEKQFVNKAKSNLQERQIMNLRNDNKKLKSTTIPIKDVEDMIDEGLQCSSYPNVKIGVQCGDDDCMSCSRNKELKQLLKKKNAN